ncbi:RNA 2',3'-cyclic phosphodiesterase [Amphritea pacifica]|uniref:RNA 2',3'-cyclic phosphodiesterase n=1 Tax=Amphritea pacifica TaxID=2811233 RepID=A0ABS2W3D7_9GAMM|nr:RNA 2',3'-cyclic phosphodiesterase [Amphritea pacifica]MBN1008884.1 RNA 2',3'-cyclic phosphodiesterase [Amphritea pacifica]
MRTFISIEPPIAVRHSIRRCCPQLKNLRLLPVEQLHLTLLFLGDQPHTICDSVRRAFEQLTLQPFTIRLRGIGQFRSTVIWLGVECPQPLQQLQQTISLSLQQQNIPFEARRFHPHLTLGRSRKPLTPPEVKCFSEALQEQEFSFTLSSILLKKSKLHATGAIHSTLIEWAC